MNPTATEPLVPATTGKADWLDVVHHKVEALRFGSIQIIVHDGRVTQIESLEKTRFTSPREEHNPPS